MKLLSRTLLLTILTISGYAQSSIQQPGASEIKQRIKKLNFLGSVLYVAAHPDDENTRAIAYLVNDQLAATAYLSMTRGDGGQNLIGPEFRDLLGLIRTQELLAARRIDGGQQFFTRANDFGFSKSADETFELWNKAEILSDVVRVIRQFQPDVMLTRFPPDKRAGHGHHTASAILAQEGFDLAADKSFHPEQLTESGTWQVRRLFTNTGIWWSPGINEKTPGINTMNVGAYNPLLGKSSSEIAGQSRTQHKSQGFGSPGNRGDALEYFELVKGDSARKNIFEKINTTWGRIKGAEKISSLVDQAVSQFKDENPSASVPKLLVIRKEISGLPVSVWKDRKLKEVNLLIQDCLGLYLDVSANQYWYAPGQPVKAAFEIINRSPATISLKQISAPLLQFDTTLALPLTNNKLVTFNSKRILAGDATYSDPYWLRNPHTQGLFTVPNEHFIGKPENDPAISYTFEFQVQGEKLMIIEPLLYKWTDPVKGEQTRPVEIVPPVFVNLDKKVYLFSNEQPGDFGVLIKSSIEDAQGTLKPELPAGWRSEPASIPFALKKRGEEQTFHFKIYPGKEEMNGSIGAFAEMGGQSYKYAVQTIQYDHIPVQTLLPRAKAKVIHLEIKHEGAVIAYIRGAGDDVPESLRALGYQVWEMKDEEVTAANLKKVDAVMVGIRALNTNERVRYFMPLLLDYVHDGGTMISQYNNNNGLQIDADKFSPYPITLSRDRVTEENSEVRILQPDNSLLNYPNKINAADFKNWVQERGLYYPSVWDSHYTALLSSNDKGESPLDGGLLVASYGKGHYIYTGLSFFRQLPEGVPGAYKLMANILSIGKNTLQPQQNLKPGK